MGQFQLCMMSSECKSGTTCQTFMGVPVMICLPGGTGGDGGGSSSGGDAGGSSSSSGGGDAAPSDAATGG
jgi:hypothetical protein